MSPRRPLLLVALCLAAGAVACSPDADPEPAKTYSLTAEQLLDPAACKDCHPKHYKEWSGSMHAYAGEDPVFLAMNRRGQRETKGALGDFCVKCHAPMAVRTGATTDGLDLAELDPKLRGITCVFCHTAAEVKGDHNAPITLADDKVLRAGIDDPRQNTAHRSGYSALVDAKKLDSSRLCGSCHDIVTPAGLHLERTFAEYKQTIFADDKSVSATSCSACHMHTDFGIAGKTPGAGLRTVHNHEFPGVDVALTPFPDRENQLQHVRDDLASTLIAQLCVQVTDTDARIAEVMLQNVGAGHAFPSGATQDRRAWVEVIATKAGKVIHSSGAIGDQQALTDNKDADLWHFGERMTDKAGKHVHMFWEAAKTEGELLAGAPGDATAGKPDADTRRFRVYKLPAEPDEITMRVRIRPMALDALRDLVKTGDLDPEIVAAMPVHDLLGTELTWRKADAKQKVTASGLPALCVPKLLVQGADDPQAKGEPYEPGMTRTTKSGALTVTLQQATPAPPRQGQNSWLVKVTDKDGMALPGLSLSAGTWMPDHHHGSPIIGKSKDLGGGSYRVEPIDLFMPGLWEITVGVTGKDGAGKPLDDKVVFRFWAKQ